MRELFTSSFYKCELWLREVDLMSAELISDRAKIYHQGCLTTKFILLTVCSCFSTYFLYTHRQVLFFFFLGKSF